MSESARFEVASLTDAQAGLASSAMDAAFPLDQMTTAEKLRAMEALWADLTRQADNYESPAWHGEVLRERDQLIAEDREPSTDWETAKRNLRDRLR